MPACGVRCLRPHLLLPVSLQLCRYAGSNGTSGPTAEAAEQFQPLPDLPMDPPAPIPPKPGDLCFAVNQRAGVGVADTPDTPRYTVGRILGGQRHRSGAFVLQVQLMRQTDVGAITYRLTPNRTLVPLANVHPVAATPDTVRQWWKLTQGFDTRAKFVDPQAAQRQAREAAMRAGATAGAAAGST